MGKRKSIPAGLARGGSETDEGHELIARAYVRARVDGEACVRLEDCASLDSFQAAFAAAEEWQAAGFIEILDAEQEDMAQGLLIRPIRFRRLK